VADMGRRKKLQRRAPFKDEQKKKRRKCSARGEKGQKKKQRLALGSKKRQLNRMVSKTGWRKRDPIESFGKVTAIHCYWLGKPKGLQKGKGGLRAHALSKFRGGLQA